jgi:nucleotide-binding universal stress UspA family protein
MIPRILVPLDGSRASESALWHALAVVDALAGGLLLLQVLVPGGNAEEDVEHRFHRTEASAYLDQMARRLAEQGADVVTSVAIGGVAEEIVRSAERDDVVMIVLTSHGRGAASGFAFGGTAHKVLSQVPTSVMVVQPQGPDERSATVIHYDRVLVPIDGTSASEWALFPAASIAQRHGAALHVLHIVPEVRRTAERLPVSPEEEELLERLVDLRHQRATRYLAEVAGMLARDDLAVDGRLVQTSDPAEGVGEVAEEDGVDLIALEARCATSTRGRLGSLARQLLDCGRLPVLVFQDSAGAIGREATRRWSGGTGTE